MQTEHSIPGNRSFNLPLTTCATCKMTWLTPGLAEGDRYECKNCGSSFIVRRIPENLLPTISIHKQIDRN
jgi:DNA-directed RNA polymerase subunit RPC12/RpoP